MMRKSWCNFSHTMIVGVSDMPFITEQQALLLTDQLPGRVPQPLQDGSGLNPEERAILDAGQPMFSGAALGVIDSRRIVARWRTVRPWPAHAPKVQS